MKRSSPSLPRHKAHTAAAAPSLIYVITLVLRKGTGYASVTVEGARVTPQGVGASQPFRPPEVGSPT